uniref:Uncharacterized protein n=1 Tax=uncultured marine microorganism HF4000_005H07 TaxID=455506 RepID=B3T0F7_9ZZZZ|nr:hypothetical protein ALOHA_HF4000005H07ctg2g10 [uncultured marine microorganism HF4000_005H07]
MEQQGQQAHLERGPVGEERDRMNDYYITVESPTRARRGSTRLIVVVKDAQGTEIFRDRADINEEKIRTKVAEHIAQFTGDTADDINQRLLQGLAHLQPPGNAGGGAGAGGPAPGGHLPCSANHLHRLNHRPSGGGRRSRDTPIVRDRSHPPGQDLPLPGSLGEILWHGLADGSNGGSCCPMGWFRR